MAASFSVESAGAAATGVPMTVAAATLAASCLPTRSTSLSALQGHVSRAPPHGLRERAGCGGAAGGRKDAEGASPTATARPTSQGASSRRRLAEQVSVAITSTAQGLA